MKYSELRNGKKIPLLGYGTYKLNERVSECVSHALQVGYRHVDCAELYDNQVEVGKGLKISGLKREDFFVTSKVWNDNREYEKTLKSFDKTLKDLQLDYLDLFLIHWPANEKQFPKESNKMNLETWRALTKLYKDGKVKAIGVSNFLPHHLEPLIDTEIKPMVNQIEFHLGLLQAETLKYCKENGIIVEGWRPLGKTAEAVKNETVMRIAKANGKTPAQICLRWVLQNGVIPLVKSKSFDRIEENFNIFDFELLNKDMNELNKIPYFFGSGHNPDTVEF